MLLFTAGYKIIFIAFFCCLCVPTRSFFCYETLSSPKLCIIELLFIFLVGLGVMAVSLWLLFDHQLYMQSIGAQQTDYYVGTYIILAVGGIMTLVGNTFQSQLSRFRI